MNIICSTAHQVRLLVEQLLVLTFQLIGHGFMSRMFGQAELLPFTLMARR